MELSFEYSQELGPGLNPAAVHLPNNSLMLLNLKNGSLKYLTAPLAPGDINYGTVIFGREKKGTRDLGLSFVKVKNVPRLGLFGVWHQAESPYNEQRHRFAIYEEEMELSKYVIEGSIELSLDSPIAAIALSLENPEQVISGEERSRLAPGGELRLSFQSGDSEDYPLGVFYVDRISMQANSSTVNLDGRNMSGKLLKDQSFDQNNIYSKKAYALNVEELLLNSGIEKYQVQLPEDLVNAWQLGMEFPGEMNYLEGLQELLACAKNWVMKESLDGEILIGSSVTFPPVNQNSRYTFIREREVFSRSITRDDDMVYGRVCIYNADRTTMVYKEIDEPDGWTVARQKTLYVEVPKNTPSEEAEERATELSSMLGRTGVQEIFQGPFRPQLLPGDEAVIVSAETKLLGLITNVKHTFGKNGFSTEFTVDSGGRMGKPLLKEYITALSQKGLKSSNCKRL